MKTLALILTIGLVLVASNVVAGVRIISGYALGEFAVVGDIEKQANELADDIKKEAQHNPNCILQVLSSGSADKTGVSIDNQDLSLKRANGIKSKLAFSLPAEAKVEALPKGDYENIRQVRVEWKFVPTASNSKLVIMVTIMAAMVSMVIIVAVLKKTKSNKKEVEKPEIPSKKAEIHWMEVKTEEGTYSVPVLEMLKDGRFTLPFYLKGSPIGRENRRGAEKAVKWCVTHKQFASQREEFLKDETIKFWKN